MGLVGTLTALVLGLLVASAKSSYDAQKNGLTQLAANVGLLDRILAHYGPEAKEARNQLRTAMTDLLNRTWPADGSPSQASEPPGQYEGLYETLQALPANNESQRTLKAAAIKTGIDIGQQRWLMFAQRGNSIPMPFLIVVVFWLAMLFASFSLFSRPNPTVVAVLLVCALSVGGAILLILELDRPFEGLLQVPSDPLRRAVELLGR
jgi:hypothetical protein